MRRHDLALPILAGALLSAVPARALKTEWVSGFGAQAAEGLEVASGRALARFGDSVSALERDAALASIGASVAEVFDTGWLAVSLAPGVKVADGVEQISALPGVLAAHPDKVFYPSRVPGDPSALSNYHLGKVNAFAAWEYDVGDSSTVTVAVMDSGIEGTHDELKNKLLNTATSKSQDCNSAPCVNNQPATAACKHGTGVAGVAAASANNGIGSAGLSWGAKVLSLKIFDGGDCNSACSNAGCVTHESRVLRSLQHARTVYLTDPAVNRLVVNMSIGANANCGFQDGALSAETVASRNAGIVLIAAAGNYSGSASGGPVQTPASCEGVIPVGATDETDQVAGFSARGSSLAAHGVVAPGVNVPMPDLNNSYTTANGTSFSAPIVSGMAALILSAKPAFTVQQVKDTLRNSSEGIGVSGLSDEPRVSGEAAGAGRVNAFRAMRLAVTGTLAGFAGDEKAIAFPNPYRPTKHGTVTITIPTAIRGTHPKIRIYTLDGQLVRDLGGNTTWDGKNDGGKEAVTGTYVFLVLTDTGSQTGRVALIR